MQRIKISTVDELEQKKQVLKKFLGKSYILQKVGNDYIAMEYMCRHQGADLSLGKEEEGIVTCHRHQWKYKKETGENIEGDGRPLKKCPIEIIGKDVYIILSGNNQEY